MLTTMRFKKIIAAAAIVAVISGPVSHAEQSSNLFAAYDENSVAYVENKPYSEIISALTISERGRTLVAYDIAHANALPFFQQYADYLANVPVSTLNRDEQLAFWLNTRNALLIKSLAEEKRVNGFRKKRGTPEVPGAFWTEKRITVEGVPLSLQDIEQDILFSGWDDPNIVFGLYQGVKGGPTLPREPFSGANVHEELAEAGRLFTSETHNFRVRGDKVRVSTYFDWYLPLAFDGDEGALRAHLATFAKANEQQVVSVSGQLSRKKLSTEFEYYRPRQVNAGSSGSSSGVSSARGYGS